MLRLTYSKFFLLLLLLVTTAFPQNGPLIRSENGMVVSAEKLASKVGITILRQGGNAIDAAVAVGFALSVTYPVAGNIGGGGYMVIVFPDGKSTTIDYRETAPFLATRDMYLDEKGEFLPNLSQKGALSAGVPGSVAGLIYAHQKYGKLPFAKVIQPAINLASDGFPLPYETAESFQNNQNSFKEFSSTMKIFSRGGELYKRGDIFRQQELAKTLTRIKEAGFSGFYEGETADLIVACMKNNGGIITHDDLRRYKPVEREPLRSTFHNYEIISMGPSSSGGVTLINMLNILENFKIEKNEWGSSRYLHLLTETMKLAYADRAEHLGDPDFFPVPTGGLISKEYAQSRSKLIGENAVRSSGVTFGKPESEQTTHYSVLDKNGIAVSVTTTINSGYGSKLVVDGAGFLLNNEMDDFSAKPGVPNQFGLVGNEANSIQPFKRMLSSMTPTVVLKNKRPFLVIGTPGGSTIITGVLQVVMNAAVFGMDLRQAIDMPRIHHQWLPDQILHEKYALSQDVIENLKKRGHLIGPERQLNLMEGILIDQEKGIIWGYSDSRGSGSAEGY
ncbi:MAG: Glutathione hydrolase proenzyme [Ignavibacteriaceae bacterium]|nr:Glutathione hydrolase proenzyme [Ignavibacteriaceae bacterium]